MLRGMKLIIRWLLLAAALLLVAHLYRGVTVASFGEAHDRGLRHRPVQHAGAAAAGAADLAGHAADLGLFLFVINALMFWWAASVLDGFSVTGFGAALIGSLIYSLCCMVIDVAMERIFSRRYVASICPAVMQLRRCLRPAGRTCLGQAESKPFKSLAACNVRVEVLRELTSAQSAASSSLS